MFFAVASSFTFFSLLVSGAPVPVRKSNVSSAPTAKLPSPDMFKIPGVNSSDIIANISAFVPKATAMATIDKSCSANASNILGALAVALTVADQARNVQVEDMAFNAFFLPQDLGSVQLMFDAIVGTNASTKTDGKQFTISCPAEGTYKFANNTNAITTDSDPSKSSSSPPQIRLNPNLFQDSTNSTASPAPSTGPALNGMFGVAFTLLQEMTHLSAFANAAALPSQSCGNSTSSHGTCDIMSQDDEKNPGKKYGDRSASPLEMAICLRSRWAAYSQQGGAGLKQPPISPSKNAGSYAAFAALYYAEKIAASNPEAQQMVQFGVGLLMLTAQQC